MEGISITGLASEHQRRIAEIGLWAWMDEQAGINAPITVKAVESKLESITRHQQVCVACGRTFYSKRSDAKYHSAACRVKGHRRGRTVTLKPFRPTSNQTLTN